MDLLSLLTLLLLAFVDLKKILSFIGNGIPLSTDPNHSRILWQRWATEGSRSQNLLVLSHVTPSRSSWLERVMETLTEAEVLLQRVQSVLYPWDHSTMVIQGSKDQRVEWGWLLS